MMDREKVNGFELCANGEPCIGEKFMKCPFSPRNNDEQNCGVTMARTTLAMLKDQESVVRCKDCIYWQDNNDGYPHIGCKWREDETPDPDDFCSAGEGREE